MNVVKVGHWLRGQRSSSYQLKRFFWQNSLTNKREEVMVDCHQVAGGRAGRRITSIVTRISLLIQSNLARKAGKNVPNSR